MNQPAADLQSVADASEPLNALRGGFTAGLITGGVIGAVLALAFAPRAGAGLRRDVAAAAKHPGAAASGRYQEATAGVRQTVGQLTTVRDNAASAVAQGAEDVAGVASSLER
jgi:gas vesicle protein